MAVRIFESFVGLTLIACTLFGAWLFIHPFIPLSVDEVNVCVAVFRYQIDTLERDIPGQIATDYLTVKHRDPPVEILLRLRSAKIAVKAGSSFRSSLYHKQRGWHSVIRSLERLDESTFLVSGGYENDGLSASGEEYTVVYRNGEWVVEKAVTKWVA